MDSSKTQVPERTLGLVEEDPPVAETVVTPEQANITIAILSDTRQAGTKRLALLITALLQREGYVSVTNPDNRFTLEDYDGDDEYIQKQLRVPVMVRTGTMSSPPPAIEIDLSNDQCVNLKFTNN